MAMIRKLIGTACLLAWIAMLVLRFDLVQVYGRGTGKNVMKFSPLDVVAYSTVHSARLRGQETHVREAAATLGVPGEIYRQIAETGKVDVSSIWESALKWSKDANKLKPVINTSKDLFSGPAAIACLVSVLAALLYPKQASLLFVAGMVGLQTSLRLYEPTARITEEYGQYALMLAFASGVALN